MVGCTQLQYKHNIKKNSTSIYYQSGTMTKMNYKSKKRNNSVLFFTIANFLFPFLWVTEKKIKILTLFWNILYTHICIWVRQQLNDVIKKIRYWNKLMQKARNKKLILFIKPEQIKSCMPKHKKIALNIKAP